MDDEQLLELIKKDMPSLDAEMLRMWLLPFAKKLSWPPNGSTDWNNRLYSQPITFWNSAVWEKRIVDFSEIEFTRNARMQVNGIYDVYVEDKKDFFFYPTLIGPSGNKNRFFRIVGYLIEHGSFPQPPIIMKGNAGLYEIADGSHRIASLVLAQKMYGIFLRMNDTQKNEFIAKRSIDEFANPSHKQYAWVCTPKHQIS